MRIVDVLHKEAVLVNLQSQDKKGVIEELLTPISDIAGISHHDLLRVLMERERLGSTGIGGGIGIPHGKLKNLDFLVLGFGLSRKGVNFESIDGQPAHIFFLLLTPENSTGLHLQILARISRLLKNELFKQKLLQAVSSDEVVNILKEEDESF